VKNLVCQMLEPDPKLRLTAKQVVGKVGFTSSVYAQGACYDPLASTQDTTFYSCFELFRQTYACLRGAVVTLFACSGLYTIMLPQYNEA
ncbi:hypothetical protein H5410_053424, partial [Solanum commersonii]